MKNAIALLVTSLFLTACGGGGGGTTAPAITDNTTQSPTPTDNTTPTPVVDYVTSDYSTKNFEKGALAALNTARTTCGINALQPLVLLDKAAKNHAEYMFLNSAEISHIETSGHQGFTGATYYDRMKYVGFLSNESISPLPSGEALTAGPIFSDSITDDKAGDLSATYLLRSVYHGAGLLLYNKNIGIANKDVMAYGGMRSRYSVFVVGTPANSSYVDNGIKTFPCEGQDVAGSHITNELPSPLPGRDFEKDPVGIPIFVLSNPSHVVEILTATISDANGVVEKVLRNSSNDPNPKNLRLGSAYVLPLRPLVGTVHVTLAGTDDSVTFNKSFTFTAK